MRCIKKNRINLNRDSSAAVGIGTMIIFIAMILVAGIAASVLLQTMQGLQSQAMKTGSDSIDEISSGLEVNHISGYQNTGVIDRLAIMVTPIAGSAGIDVSQAIITMSNMEKQIYCSYNSSIFASSISDGVFQTVNTTSLNADEFGIIVIRDQDSSLSDTSPIMTENDLIVLIMNTTKSFLGISPRVDISGKITPEYGLSGQIRFSTPSVFVDEIIELHP